MRHKTIKRRGSAGIGRSDPVQGDIPVMDRILTTFERAYVIE